MPTMSWAVLGDNGEQDRQSPTPPQSPQSAHEEEYQSNHYIKEIPAPRLGHMKCLSLQVKHDQIRAVSI